MTDTNPYAPPQSTPIDAAEPPPAGPLALAGLSRRFGAALIDVLVFAVPYMLSVTVWVAVLGAHDFQGMRRLGPDKLLLFDAGNSLSCVFIYVVLNGWLLLRNGQTIGKYLVGIRIAKPDGRKPSMVDLVLKRFAALLASQFIPGGRLALIIDPLLIFRANRRCLHDEIADTIVVLVQS